MIFIFVSVTVYQMVLNSKLDRATLFDLYERGLILKQVWLEIDTEMR